MKREKYQKANRGAVPACIANWTFDGFELPSVSSFSALNCIPGRGLWGRGCAFFKWKSFFGGEYMPTYFDPPSGWRYGFPKIVPENVINESKNTFKEWILAQGYPESMIDLAMKHSRYWESEGSHAGYLPDK